MASELSPKQRDCIDLVAQGLTDKEIGRRLGMSPRTVGSHLSEAYARLGVTNRRDAIRALRITYQPSLSPMADPPHDPPSVLASGDWIRSERDDRQGLFQTLPPPPGRVWRLMLILLVAVLIATVVAGIVMVIGSSIERAEGLAPANAL